MQSFLYKISKSTNNNEAFAKVQLLFLLESLSKDFPEVYFSQAQIDVPMGTSLINTPDQQSD